MRQICKQILTMRAGIRAFLLVLALLPAGQGMAAAISTIIVSDPLTGIAIDGWDPVSYFADPEPQKGSPENEYVWQGVSWYFSSPANRDVFIRNPEIYSPQFGGHCGMSMARGYLSDGNPTYYVLHRQRLYLFYSAGNRESFLLEPDSAASKAAKAWVELSKTLSTQ